MNDHQFDEKHSAYIGEKMKKALLLFGLSLVCCVVIWPMDFSLSTGAGGLLGGSFTRYESSSSGSNKMTLDSSQFNFGALLFFDATYAELAATIQRGSGKYDEVISKSGDFVAGSGDCWETMLGFCLLGKYPFAIMERLKLFPLLGIEYQIALSQRRRVDGGVIYDRTNGLQETDKDGKALDNSAWNSFWIHLGVGTDVDILKDFFVRGEILYGFRLMTSYEKDGLEQAKALLGDSNPKLSGLTSGPSIRLCAGYRFWNM